MAIVPFASRGDAQKSEPLKIGSLKFGTVNWLLDTITDEKLDHREGVRIERLELASNQALTVALQAGAVDLIVSDWLWAMRQRAEGDNLRFAPYSSALGALMVPRDRGFKSLADLKGKRLGVAGSALDKSWLLLRAFSRNTLHADLTEIVEPIYGAPPLLSEQLRLGRLDGVLTFWNFAARLDAAGYQPLIDMVDVMSSLGVHPAPPLVGFVWREELLRNKPEQVAGFFRAVEGANRVLKAEDKAWQRLRPVMAVETDAEFQRLKDYFRAGIPSPWGAAETQAAERLFGILNEFGGPDLVGPRTRFDPSLFWAPKA
ncbi:ABC transporter substrate-binding protein [Microvirga sp. ACRRW]|uniref:ABC transporter substrate-binding protein n=1 Tax=Microvirga sp. ACRRW TaxID=2918205 RepID=UPI001EF60846|nr:ABC transporter substrate-binding protein [Microvirga sp. ACRRW]MCG7393811.1 ABC transporter substrate-binding protein [Microvirga sp. ACRRW]